MNEKKIVYSEDIRRLPSGLNEKLENYMKKNGTTKTGAIKELLRYVFEQKGEKMDLYENLKNYMKENLLTRTGAIKELLRYAFEKKEKQEEKY